MKGSLTVTAFDTLNGNQTYKADLSASQILNSEAANAKLSLKLSDNARAGLEKLMLGGYSTPEDTELFHTLLDILEDLELIGRSGSPSRRPCSFCPPPWSGPGWPAPGS